MSPVIIGVVLLLAIAAVVVYFLVLKKDCEQSEWGTCDPITKTQVRTTTIEPKFGGEECGLLSQECIPDINCVQSDWTACDPNTSTQSRVTTTESSGAGTECGVSSQTCVPVAIDCVQSSWTACDPSTSTQSRTTITKTSGAGKVCGDLSQECVPDVDCVQSEWSMCDAATGKHSRTITTTQSGAGKVCGPLVESCSNSRIVKINGAGLSGISATSPIAGGLVYAYNNAGTKFDVYMDGEPHPLKVTGMELCIGNVNGTPQFVKCIAGDINQQLTYNGTNFLLASNTGLALTWTPDNKLVWSGPNQGWNATTLV